MLNSGGTVDIMCILHFIPSPDNFVTSINFIPPERNYVLCFVISPICPPPVHIFYDHFLIAKVLFFHINFHLMANYTEPKFNQLVIACAKFVRIKLYFFLVVLSISKHTKHYLLLNNGGIGFHSVINLKKPPVIE